MLCVLFGVKHAAVSWNSAREGLLEGEGALAEQPVARLEREEDEHGREDEGEGGGVHERGGVGGRERWGGERGGLGGGVGGERAGVGADVDERAGVSAGGPAQREHALGEKRGHPSMESYTNGCHLAQ